MEYKVEPVLYTVLYINDDIKRYIKRENSLTRRRTFWSMGNPDCYLENKQKYQWRHLPNPIHISIAPLHCW
jgi:hypothetical protein